MEYCAQHTDVSIAVPGTHVPVQASMRHLAMRPEEVEVVLAHGPCNDGFASALAAHLFNRSIKILSIDHAQLEGLATEVVSGKNVLFVDIAPTTDTLARLRPHMKKFAILDHHVTARKNMEDVPQECKVFDTEVSACRLAWAYFFPSVVFDPIGVFAAVEARDLWKQERVPDCDKLVFPLFKLRCPMCWMQFTHPGGRDRLLVLGHEMMAAHHKRVAEAAALAKCIQFTGHRTWSVQIQDAALISDVGHAILAAAPDRSADVAMTWRVDIERNRVFFSLRSLDPNGPDVAVLAEARGGGGHKHAAGFSTLFIDEKH